MEINFRASSSAPLFLGSDGLTETQVARLKELSDRHFSFLQGDKKMKLTPNMERERDILLKKKDDFDNGIIDLPQGAKSYVRELVDQMVYGYKPEFSNKEMDKGNAVEEKAIELINLYFMTDYKKSNSILSYGPHVGHPDIDEDMMIIDNKSSRNKKTFPKLSEDISNSTYEWQLKMYCYMKSKMTGEDWRTGRLVYTLMSTPEELVPEWEGDDLHNVDHLDLKLRVTYVDYELTDSDIAHIERRTNSALKFAEEYYSKLINK